VVIALVVTPDGLPLAYEVLPGNTSDKTTLAAFLEKIQSMYGRARRVWVMDRGIPTEATLKQMRQEEVAYLVGTPKALLNKLQKDLLEQPWENVHDDMAVKLIEHDGELYVQAKSEQRRKKETAMRRRKLKRLVHGLNRLKRRPPKRDRLLKRVAVLQKEAGRIASFVKVREPSEGEPVNRTTFTCRFDRPAWKAALDQDGSYILRASIPSWDDFPEDLEKRAPVLWEWYMQLVRVEEAFRTLKSDLGLRPIHHQLEHRVEAHILVAFLGYCLNVTLRMKLKASAEGLTPRAVLASMSRIQMVEVHIPTTDGRAGADPAPAHRAGGGAADDPGAAGDRPAGTTAAADPPGGAATTRRSAARVGSQFVVQTFDQKPALRRYQGRLGSKSAKVGLAHGASIAASFLPNPPS
jgi:transposase